MVKTLFQSVRITLVPMKQQKINRKSVIFLLEKIQPDFFENALIEFFQTLQSRRSTSRL